VPAIVAAAKARGITTLLDNTWATPLRFRAIEKGVDLVILAGTKYVVGHSDVMLGSVTAAPSHWRQLRDTIFQLGQVASPDDAWLGSRGLRTMAVRLAQHEASALKTARWLEERAEVDEAVPKVKVRRATGGHEGDREQDRCETRDRAERVERLRDAAIGLERGELVGDRDERTRVAVARRVFY
jgi:cystathionine beta-lyase/cystathionine gamma-synthase